MNSASPRRSQTNLYLDQASAHTLKMTILTASAPLPHMAFNNDYPWDSGRPSNYFNPRSDVKPVALPSIRQAIPELHLKTHLPEAPTSAPATSAPNRLASPEYIHSANSMKRRRITNEEEQETLRSKQVPRLYRSPERGPARQLSPPQTRPMSETADRWAPLNRSTASPTSGILTPVDMKKDAVETRITLPSLTKTINFEREAHRPREHIDDNHVTRQAVASLIDPPSAFHSTPSYDRAYRHQAHHQSQPTSPGRPYDRSPFSANAYTSHFPESRQYGDFGGMSVGGDNAKQRKRRGNLPKETTDKLRAWFVAHLQHPYPTEDEKQELMRKTGLQMNQISNWFINARRRQLPAMINNARAESDAMSRGAQGGECSKRDTHHGSDTDCGYDEDVDSLRLPRSNNNMKRGSV